MHKKGFIVSNKLLSIFSSWKIICIDMNLPSASLCTINRNSQLPAPKIGCGGFLSWPFSYIYILYCIALLWICRSNIINNAAAVKCHVTPRPGICYDNVLCECVVMYTLCKLIEMKGRPINSVFGGVFTL